MILGQTNFSPALIISFNSALFVEINVNNLLLFFSVYSLTFSQSWFVRDGNLVFFSNIILFIISAFIFLLVFVFVPWGLGVWCFDCYYFMVHFL